MTQSAAPSVLTQELALVNAAHGIHADWKNDLIPLGPPSILLQRTAATALKQLLDLINSNGRIIPVSGYRGFREQARLYRDSLEENGEAFTKKYVALPGHSEHQTGLAIDLALNKRDIDRIRPDFPYDGICGAFRELAPRHGFIERYPAGKEAITGITHEPWHFRYVGWPHSEIISKFGLTLEEYIGCMRHFSGYSNHLPWRHEGGVLAIFHLPEYRPESCPEGCRISGTNGSGYIVTCMEASE